VHHFCDLRIRSHGAGLGETLGCGQGRFLRPLTSLCHACCNRSSTWPMAANRANAIGDARGCAAMRCRSFSRSPCSACNSHSALHVLVIRGWRERHGIISASAVGARSCFEMEDAQTVQGILSSEMTRSGVPAACAAAGGSGM
jgi:hypothetical protein